MKETTEQSRHDLRASVAPDVSVALAVYEKGERVNFRNADARFHAVRLPENVSPLAIQELLGLVRR